jgi:thiol:disulfide interchange protein DsbD
MLHIRKALLIIFFCSLAAGCSKSAVNNPQSSTSDANEPPRIASVDVVEAIPQEATLARGESGDAIVPIKITSGYHVNANPPSYPYLKATEIELQAADGISVEYVTYPDPLTRKFAFAETPIAVYEGETVVKVRLKVDKGAKPGKHNLSAKLRVQACDEKVCYAPGVEDVIVPVNIK